MLSKCLRNPGKYAYLLDEKIDTTLVCTLHEAIQPVAVKLSSAKQLETISNTSCLFNPRKTRSVSYTLCFPLTVCNNGILWFWVGYVFLTVKQWFPEVFTRQQLDAKKENRTKPISRKEHLTQYTSPGQYLCRKGSTWLSDRGIKWPRNGTKVPYSILFYYYVFCYVPLVFICFYNCQRC